MQRISSSCTSCLPVWVQDSSHYLIEKITAVISPIFQVLKNLFCLCCCNRPSSDVETPPPARSIIETPTDRKKGPHPSAGNTPFPLNPFKTPDRSRSGSPASPNHQLESKKNEEVLTPFPSPLFTAEGPTEQRIDQLSSPGGSSSPPLGEDQTLENHPHFLHHTAHDTHEIAISSLCATGQPKVHRQDTLLDLDACKKVDRRSRSPSEKSDSPFSQEGTPRNNPVDPPLAVRILPKSDSLSPEDVTIIPDETLDDIFGDDDTSGNVATALDFAPKEDLTRPVLQRDETGASGVSAGDSLIDPSSPMARSPITALSKDAADLVEQMITEKSALRRSLSGTAGSPPEKHPARGNLYTGIEDPISALAHILSNEELFSLLTRSKNNWAKFKEILDKQLDPITNLQVLEEIATILSEYLAPEDPTFKEAAKGHILVIFKEPNRGTALFEFIRHYKDRKPA